MLRVACLAAVCAVALVPASVAACDWAPTVYRSLEVTGDMPECLSVQPDDRPGEAYETQGERIAFRVRNACDEEAGAMVWPADCPDCEVREEFGQLEYETALLYDEHIGETVTIPLTWESDEASGTAALQLELPDTRPSEQKNGCDGIYDEPIAGCSVGHSRRGVFGMLVLVLLGCVVRRRSAVRSAGPRPALDSIPHGPVSSSAPPLRQRALGGFHGRMRRRCHFTTRWHRR